MATSTTARPRGRHRQSDRKLTTMGGLLLALGIVSVFWTAVGVGLWAWLG